MKRFKELGQSELAAVFGGRGGKKGCGGKKGKRGKGGDGGPAVEELMARVNQLEQVVMSAMGPPPTAAGGMTSMDGQPGMDGASGMGPYGGDQ